MCAAVIAASGTTARAEAWEAGEQCVLSRAVKVSARPGGKGKKTRVLKGATLTLLDV
jgi:hypothetical protein